MSFPQGNLDTASGIFSAASFNLEARLYGLLGWTVNPSLALTPYQTTSGFWHGVPIILEAGDVVSTISPFYTVAGAGATHAIFGLHDPGTLKVLAQSADLPANAQATGWVNYPLQTPYRVTKTGLYLVGDLITATTMPTWVAPTNVASGVHNLPNGQILSLQDTTGFTALPNPPPNPSSGAHRHCICVF